MSTCTRDVYKISAATPRVFFVPGHLTQRHSSASQHSTSDNIIAHTQLSPPVKRPPTRHLTFSQPQKPCLHPTTLSPEDHLDVEAEVLRGSEDSNTSTNLITASSADSENDGDFTTVGRRNARASPEARAARTAVDQAERDRLMASGQAKRLDFSSHRTPAQRLADQARDQQRHQEYLEREARRQAARQQRQAEFEARQTARQRREAEHQAYLARVARRHERAEREAREKEKETKRNQASLMDFAQSGRGQQRRR
ncbi:hypothetical protein AC579_10204 [Pseudocercospora musae]|uniref:Uncharacterized protein n=1 Tax=Pseudocercospora musae TaxID=113226 RepID=A0A139I419_9PEZI|nr:hypothetical protein AC579_10204 [Pseudocercospora musae]